jgi:GNAT superfamily N-acetyltransferase
MKLTHRLAELDDIARLNAIAFRAKAHWGYSAAQMEVWRAELEVAPEWVRCKQVGVALHDGSLAGYFAIVNEASGWRLEHLWVEPSLIGLGVGRALLQAACSAARERGAQSLILDADPHAAGFYTRCGAVLVGTKPAPVDADPLRTLPVFCLPVPLSASPADALPLPQTVAD